MEEEQNQVTERILNLTLEIIYLLTGKDYAVVKTSGQPSAPGVLSSDLQKKRKNNRKKILKATSQIIGLLAGEDWETEEENEDPRNGVKIENCTTQTPQDWASIRNSSDRCILVEDQEVQHQVQGGGAGGIKTEYAMAEGKKDAYAEQNQAFITQDGLYGQESPETPVVSLVSPPPPPPPPKTRKRRKRLMKEVDVDPNLPQDHTGTDLSASNSDWVPASTTRRRKRSVTMEGNLFPCPECGKCFTNMPNRIRHMKIHKGLKPFACADCGKCFARKSHVSKHQLTHTDEKPVSCTVCGKCFKHESHLVIHHRSHTGEKPFVCADCGKCFAKKFTLLHHQKTHHGDGQI